MWIPSSPCKNRVSDRGRIDVFSQRSISAVKASLLLLALASFSVVCAASDLPEWCRDKPDTCFATSKDDLKDGPRTDIGFDDGKITWDATDDSKEAPIELYSQECGKLSFIMSNPGDDCKFSMQYPECDLDLKWLDEDLKFYKKGVKAGVLFGPTVNGELNSTHFTDGKNSFAAPCDFKPSHVVDKWCSFEFAFKKTGSCNGEIQFDKGYKLLATPAPTTAAPETTPTTDADYENTTPGTDAAGLSPWIIAGIVVAVLLLVAVVVGLLVFFLIRRRKRSVSPQNMVEKGNVENDPQCVSALSHTNTTQVAATNMKSGSEMVGEPSANEHKEDEERSKPASKVEVVKPMSQKKKKDNTYQSLAILQKEEAKNEPAPSPSPLPEENKPKRKLTPDELYEPLGDPMKAIPMHLSEKKISEKKISSKKQKKKVEEEAKNTPATPSPSRSSKKKKSEKKKKDDHYHRLSSLENEAKK